MNRISGGSLQPERGHSETQFEGINGESKASGTVKCPVRIGSQDGYVQASVILGRAPFLLSIQALQQMKAKLDCERDILEMPGIGEVKLTTNHVGHYLLPLFQFGYHTAEDPSVAVEGEYEDLTRPPGLDVDPGANASVQGSGDVGSGLKRSPPSKTGQPLTEDVFPPFESVARRSEHQARTVFLRLAKDTRGP